MCNSFIKVGKMILISGLAVFCLLLSGCNRTVYGLSDGVYVCSGTEADYFPMAVSLDLTENRFEFGSTAQNFTFTANGIAGTVEINEGKVAATTDSGTLTFVFEIKDNDTICFVQDGSADLVMTNGDGEFTLTDGAEFVLEDRGR